MISSVSWLLNHLIFNYDVNTLSTSSKAQATQSQPKTSILVHFVTRYSNYLP